MRVNLRHKHKRYALEVEPEDTKHRVIIDDREYVVETHALDERTAVLIIDGRHYRVDMARNGSDLLVGVGGETYVFAADAGAVVSHCVATIGPPEIIAPMPGKILQLLVRAGDHVDAGDGLLILEAMKMENRLVAEAAATVVEVRIAEGAMVDGGQVLIVLQYDDESERTGRV